MNKQFNPVQFGEALNDIVNTAHDLVEDYMEHDPEIPPEVAIHEIMTNSSTAILRDLMEASSDNYEECREALMGFIGVTRVTAQIAIHLMDIAQDLKK